MILNPTHEITLSGLPSEVLDAYVRYKKGSRAIVTWLVEFGPSKYRGVRSLPIRELARLAYSASSKIKELPEVVHFHFKETIAARKCLSRFFRKNVDDSEDEFGTVNHEHFTKSLSQIYADLCECCQKSHRSSGGEVPDCDDLSTRIRNHYACLPVEEAVDDEILLETTSECTDCAEDMLQRSSSNEDCVCFEGDHLTIAVETSALIERASTLFDAVRSCWSDAARGSSSIVASAGVTNAVWTSLKQIASQLQNLESETSVDALMRRLLPFRTQRPDGESSSGTTSKRYELLQRLRGPEQAIKHYIDNHRLTTVSSCMTCLQQPSDYISSSESGSTNENCSLAKALLDNILHLITGKSPPSKIVLSGTPCFSDIGYLLTHPDDHSTELRCMFGLHLLFVSYQAYLVNLGRPSSISLCRISSLKLAKQTISSIDDLLQDKNAFPCHCPQTIAFHLVNLKSDFEAYARQKCWDLYFQSPWVAASHIIEMLDTTSYYGMRLLHYRHYIGSILHTYNVLVQLAGLEKISLLEELCNTFRDVMFPGGVRPVSNFRNSWSRFAGARLKFKKGHRSRNHRESWCMALPAHEARRVAGFNSTNGISDRLDPKFDYTRVDLLMKLKQQDYHVDHSMFEEVDMFKKSRHLKTTIATIAVSMANTTPPPSSIEAVQAHHLPSLHKQLNNGILSSSSPPASSTTATTTTLHLPTTTLNLLKIFTKITNLINKISTESHTTVDDHQKLQGGGLATVPAPIVNCICFNTTILTGADRILESRRYSRTPAVVDGAGCCWKKEERTVIDIVKKNIVNCFQELSREDWSWQI